MRLNTLNRLCIRSIRSTQLDEATLQDQEGLRTDPCRQGKGPMMMVQRLQQPQARSNKVPQHQSHPNVRPTCLHMPPPTHTHAPPPVHEADRHLCPVLCCGPQPLSHVVVTAEAPQDGHDTLQGTTAWGGGCRGGQGGGGGGLEGGRAGVEGCVLWDGVGGWGGFASVHGHQSNACQACRKHVHVSQHTVIAAAAAAALTCRQVLVVDAGWCCE